MREVECRGGHHRTQKHQTPVSQGCLEHRLHVKTRSEGLTSKMIQERPNTRRQTPAIEHFNSVCFTSGSLQHPFYSPLVEIKSTFLCLWMADVGKLISRYLQHWLSWIAMIQKLLSSPFHSHLNTVITAVLVSPILLYFYHKWTNFPPTLIKFLLLLFCLVNSPPSTHSSPWNLFPFPYSKTKHARILHANPTLFLDTIAGDVC